MLLFMTGRSWKVFIVVLLQRHKFAIVTLRWPIVLMRFQWTLYDNIDVDILLSKTVWHDELTSPGLSQLIVS